MLHHLQNEWQRLVNDISQVHQEPIFVSADVIKGRLLPSIVIIAILLTILYIASFSIVHKFVSPDVSAKRKSKVCYQITNICFNVVIGSVGVYLEYWVLPTLSVDESSRVGKIIGHEKELFMVSALQLGYQLWAIPIGVFYVGESTEMILHHLAVVVSGFTSGFLSIGFRYYCPFFYGIMELSSLPLSVMNSFKDNPEWIEKYPKAYELSRAIFAISFLTIRNVMCASRWPWFLRDNAIVFYTKEMGLYKIFMFVQVSLAFFLAYLQLLWGSIIIRNILKTFVTSKGGQKEQSKQD